MDRGDLEGTEKEIVAAENLLEAPGKQAGWRDRLLLLSRLDLARGDAKSAYRRLKEGRQRWWMGAEGYALLAVAANESGHDRIAKDSMERAESRGVDVRALREARSTANRR